MSCCLFCCLRGYSELIMSCFKCNYYCSSDIKNKSFYALVNVLDEFGYETESSSDEEIKLLNKSIADIGLEKIESKNYVEQFMFIEKSTKEFYYYYKYFKTSINIHDLESISQNKLSVEEVKRFSFISEGQRYVIDEDNLENGLIVFRFGDN